MATSNRKVLSFDLDGTLVRGDFTTAIWREAIPALLADQRGMSLEQAKHWAFEQYDEVGEGALEWYIPEYWFERFGIEEDWRETLTRHRSLIRLFPEVRDVLEALAQDHRLIVLSNASHPFLRAEMEEAGLNGLFEHAVSATSDLGEVKKTHTFYGRVCRMLGLEPQEVIHVGDHWVFDFIAPARAGIQAFFLDRSGQREGPGIVRDLEAFARHVSPRE